MFKPIDFLNFSKSLLNKRTINENEAFYRSIISRSYYSTLLTVREKIDEFNKDILRQSEKKSSHDDIIDNMTKLPTDKLNIFRMVKRGLGVEFVRLCDPYDLKETEMNILDALRYENGLSVVILKSVHTNKRTPT